MSKSRVIIFSVVAAAVGIGLGVIIGYFSHPSNSSSSTTNEYFRDLDTSLLDDFVNQVDPNNIRESLNYFAAKPHMATSPRDEELANYIQERWAEQLDEAYLTPYEMMHGFLSEDPNKPNQVRVEEPSTGEVSFTAIASEIVYSEYMESPETIVPYYSAYGPPGDVQGKLVYANFGSDEDYFNLIQLGVNLNGKIVLVKYGGGVGRGGKALIAETYNVSGVLVYSDPESWVVEGEKGYPEDSSLPGTGVQRGSTLPAYGDPSTPNYPSTNYSYRVPVEDMEGLPPIPLQPIGYDDAALFMRLLGGSNAPGGWSTGLDVDEFRVGPGFASPNETEEVRIIAHNIYKTTKSYNVIGVIRGKEEPDNYVMYGNHRDSWVYGAVDPSSGTSCMMEITRIYGILLSNGWRPRRSIIFASWGSEEFGLMGSTEWAEDNLSLLWERAVSYINVDIAVFANTSFFARASPSLTQVLADAADVSDENDPSKTLKEIWMENFPNSVNNSEDPLIGRLYSSSDYAYFYQILGITSADLSYRGNANRDPRYRISPYPTYHTAYDTFDYVKRFVDPGFYAHQAVTRVAGNALLRLADSLIIPFSLSHFADFIQSQVGATETNFGTTLTQQDISLKYLKQAGSNLKQAVADFETYVEKSLDRKNFQEVTSVNNRLLGFERCFIEPTGLPGQPQMKHVSGSSGSLDDSSGSFPGIQDSIFQATKDPDNQENWKIVHQQVALATYKISTATKLLQL